MSMSLISIRTAGWTWRALTRAIARCTSTGPGNSTPLRTWETGLIANANQIDFGDYDGDGDLDMVMAAGEPCERRRFV